VQWFKSVILATQDSEIRGITVWGQPEPKFIRFYFNQLLGCFPATWGNTNRKITPGDKVRSYLKNNQCKKGLVEWLKWESSCLASVRAWVQPPIWPNKPKQKQKKKKSLLSMYCCNHHCTNVEFEWVYDLSKLHSLSMGDLIWIQSLQSNRRIMLAVGLD
jgi:hypothetical protein